MKHYLLLSCCLLAMVLFGACTITPLAPTATPAEALQPTFTPTTAVTTTAAVTATTAITIAVTPTGTLTATTSLSPTTGVLSTTGRTPVTATTALTLTPVLTPTTIVTPAATTLAGAATPAPQSQGNTIAAILAARPDFATLSAAVEAVQLSAELSGDAPYTLFAPTEDAFAALPAGTLDTLLANPSTLASVIQNHLLIEEVSAARLVRLGSVLTTLGQTLPVTLTATGVVQVGNATVIEADIEATNGMIHAIDTVLLPADLVITPTLGITGASATAQVTATQAVTTAQIITSIAPTATIASIVQGTDELSRLESALGAAGLLQALQLPGQLTLFAPTNAAFAALPANQLQTLLNNTTAIANVMQYHLVADAVVAADLVRLGQALSTSSQPLQITVADDGIVLVNNARIIQADIVTTNGVIHLIDAVLLPPAK
jgi:transforming growth factor-beta-induced protein